MEEILELRVNLKFAHLLFAKNEGKDLGTAIKLVQISTTDPRYAEIAKIEKQLDGRDESFFYGWRIIRKYNKDELSAASLFQMKIIRQFEPCGEEAGTVYDKSSVCPICGAGAKQIGPLFLPKSAIGKKDIARTIADEIVVSEKFAGIMQKHGVKGMLLEPVLSKKGKTGHYQLKTTSPNLEITPKTLAGVTPFDLSEYSEAFDYNIQGGPSGRSEKEIYKCPNGDNIGLNLLSEVHVFNHSSLDQYDLFQTRQSVGVRRGLLRQTPVMLCSPLFRDVVLKEKLTGFQFDVAFVDLQTT